MDFALLMKAQRDKMQALFDKTQADGGRDFTDDEKKEYDAAEKEFYRLKAAKEQQEKLNAMQNDIPKEPAPKAHEPASNSNASVHNIHAGDDLSTEKPYKNLGGMLIDVIRAGKFNDGHAIDTLKNAALGQNTEVGSDGGFLVPPNFMGNMMERVSEESNLASRVSEIQLSQGNSVSIPGVNQTSRAAGYRYGGIQVYWVREGDSLTPKKSEFRNLELKLAKLAGLVYLTEEMMEDSAAVESWVNMAFPAEMAFTLDQAIYNGNGNGVPLGFLNSNALVTVARATASQINYADVLAMWSRMPAKRMARAAWFITQQGLEQLAQMSLTVGTGGSTVYVPPGGASVEPYGTLFGRPVIPIEQAVALGTEGDISLCDMSDYIAITKGGLRKDASIHVQFLTDQMAFRFIRRVNGAPYTNVKLQSKSSSTFYTSPYITLTDAA